ncbi:solute carrier family 35 member F6-like isoform X2 [Penaeus japonicus]|uniref:solute carrier family 35 member F6-like isoform X2 n=1 Tax=Penaeus japonicus TaxID=27405 RepID=UPI001C712927|nr:solute carrier family 35 member F6-like isoform X2 [Penaeus japonicus]
MSWTKKQIMLALLLVVTGSINTLSTKWADTMESVNSVGEEEKFNHPFFQADGMFLGEILCLITFYIQRTVIRRRQREQIEMAPVDQQDVKFPKVIFLAPAFCDMLATSTMYLGLTLTYASSFQMLRGAVIIFTGLLSVAFLGRKLRYFQWLGILAIIAGLIVVGVSDFMSGDTEGEYTLNGIITGDLLIIAAQIVTATQMVVEEKFVTGYRVPALQAVGWEGIFGFTALSILLVAFYWIPAGIFSGNPREVLEDVPDAFIQLGNNPLLIVAVLGNIISIAFFNFAGISVTKELSATTRMVLDSVRTLVIWLFSLAVGWQQFQYLQPIGFGVLLIGMMLYNDMFILPFCRSQGWVNDALPEDTEPVLAGNSSQTNESPHSKEGIDNPDATVEPL